MKRSLFSSLPPLRRLLSLVTFLLFLDAIHVCVCVCSARRTPAATPAATISRTITVDIAGSGDFRSVQAAIDSVPTGNTRWVRIFIKRGIYKEKVEVPRDRPFIVVEGEDAQRTVIQWGDYVGHGKISQVRLEGSGGQAVERTLQTGTFTLRADNFVARRITFKNTYSDVESNPQTQALAALIEGDKAAFYSCHFVGFQDTLCDNRGRHYFHDCYIEGFVDFIFGSGQSIYDLCNIWVRGSPKPWGYITAHGRGEPKSSSGFVFRQCRVTGAGKAFLGRAWGTYPFVLFYRTYMSNTVVPAGWDPFREEKRRDLMTFAEKDCFGPGSDLSDRVKWEKTLTNSEIRKYTSMSFIDREGWLGRQPGGQD